MKMGIYWGDNKYNEVEIIITNLVSGIYAQPTDPVLLVDDLRDYVIGQLKQRFNCNDTMLVKNLKTKDIYEVHSSLLKPISFSIGSLQSVFFKTMLQMAFLNKKLYVIDKCMYPDEQLIMYKVDLTPNYNFITPLLIAKNECDETFTIDLGIQTALTFIQATPYGNDVLRGVQFTAGLLKGQLVDLFPIDYLCVGPASKIQECPQEFNDVQSSVLKDVLFSQNINLYQIEGGTNYFTLPAFEAASICLFDRAWSYNK